MKTEKGRIAVITGTGVTEQFELADPKGVHTPYGVATIFRHASGGFFLLPRHGAAHKSPPHGINYRANIAALDHLGVRRIIATSAVGSMDRSFAVGEVGLLDQFIDFTKHRQATFFEKKVAHTDMTSPYSSRLNKVLSVAAQKMGLRLSNGLVYVCAEGPRFETAAEIKMFRILGGDVVGMTGVPEVVLANERGIEYSSVVIATNWAAGLQPKVSHEEVLKVMRKSGRKVKVLIETAVRDLAGEGG
jgi:5'-methylthioadenosine phosphorylase